MEAAGGPQPKQDRRGEQMETDLSAISDGRLYGTNDMVRVGCHDCRGCSSCCEDMGTSILLDPYDTYQLTTNLGKSFEQLLQNEVELHVEAGVVLPNLRMREESTKSCSFLDKNGRCLIHSFRPGICRLFPLGRNYEKEALNYFLLVDACPASNKSKMKVQKWLDTPQIKSYEKFLIDWHNLVKKLRAVLEEQEETMAQQLSTAFLQMFYLKPYQKEQFYEEFYQRLERFQMVLNV